MAQRKGTGEEPSDERRAVVLMEQLRSEFKVVTEGHKGVTERLRLMDARLERMETIADERHQALKKYLMDGLDKADADIKSVENRLANVEGRL